MAQIFMLYCPSPSAVFQKLAANYYVNKLEKCLSIAKDVDELNWLEGYFGTVAYQLDGMAKNLPRLPRRGRDPV